jgi:hypothetical protein
MTLSVSRLYTVDDRKINEYEAIHGLQTGMGNWSTQEKTNPIPTL